MLLVPLLSPDGSAPNTTACAMGNSTWLATPLLNIRMNFKSNGYGKGNHDASVLLSQLKVRRLSRLETAS